MSRQVVYEVTQPFHKNGREVLYQPGDQLPLDADLPEGLSVREVVAEVPGPDPEPDPDPDPKVAVKAGRAGLGKGT